MTTHRRQRTWHRRTPVALWVVFAYLLLLYIMFRWNWHPHGSPQMYPGND